MPPPLATSIGLITSIHGGVSHYFDNDEKDATRTLFIGNLDQDLEKEYIRKLFEKYGVIEDIDIKRNQPMQPPYMLNALSGSSKSELANLKKTYAFIRYENMDMAREAKLSMNGKKLGSNEIKIGYGKYENGLLSYCFSFWSKFF
jgi:RNA-binding protein 15